MPSACRALRVTLLLPVLILVLGVSVTGPLLARVRAERSLMCAGWERTEIWIVDVATTRERRLTRSRLGDDSPVWSSDGSQIAFVRTPWAMARSTS